MKKITKKEFIAAAKKGWERRTFSGFSFDDGESACAIGAAALGMNVDKWKLMSRLGGSLSDEISEVVWGLKSKKAAIAAITKMKWRNA